MNGWWKFHRRMEDHAVWSLPAEHVKVWLTIINHANIEDKDWDDGTRRVLIRAGSFVTSQEHLADYAKVGRQSVRAAIKNLIRLESISTKIATNRYTIITVTNWPTYNGIDIEANQLSNQQPTNSQPTANHDLRIKEGKKERKRHILLANPDGFAVFWSAYPRKEGKAAAEKAWTRLNPQNGLVETILKAIDTHRQTWTDRQYIPHPATFLNGRRWEDVLIDRPAPLVPVQAKPDPKRLWKTKEEYQKARRLGIVRPREIPEWEATP